MKRIEGLLVTSLHRAPVTPEALRPCTQLPCFQAIPVAGTHSGACHPLPPPDLMEARASWILSRACARAHTHTYREKERNGFAIWLDNIGETDSETTQAQSLALWIYAAAHTPSRGLQH